MELVGDQRIRVSVNSSIDLRASHACFMRTLQHFGKREYPKVARVGLDYRMKVYSY